MKNTETLKAGQKGVTLVEILMALAIGLTISLALFQLLTQSLSARGQIERTGQKIESGRYALDFIGNEARLAGFYGEFIPGLIDSTLNSLCDGGAVRADDLTWNPTATLPAAVRGIAAADVAGDTVDGCLGLPNYQNGTDVLVVWRADTATLVPRKRVIYVAQCNVCGTPDGIPTLKEVTITSVGGAAVVAAPVALALGVENLHVEYGIDNDVLGAASYGVVDEYKVPSAPIALTDWPNVMAARAFVLVRDLAVTPAHKDTNSYVLGSKAIAAKNDQFRRRVFSSTAVLTNVIGRREQ